jgi:thiol-disulfide isomerase/thioredoxin/DNA-binding beta-propeller fold protein YncE
MKLTSKDKSLLILISAVIIVLWALFSFISNALFVGDFEGSDLGKIVASADENNWLNVAQPLKKDDLKDRVILLNVWNRSCVDCTQSLDVVKELRNELGSRLTVIGVYLESSPKENTYSSALGDILKYDITYPVIAKFNNSSVLKVAKDLPTLVLINTRGKIVKTYSGKKEIAKIKDSARDLVSKFKYQINHDPLPLRLEKNNAISNILSFPTKLEYVADFSYEGLKNPAIFIADTGNHSIVVSSLSGSIILRIGSDRPGFKDGSFDEARFNMPQGLLYDKEKLYIADLGNNALRVVDFKAKKVATLIGSGDEGSVLKIAKPIKAKEVKLSSPHDIEFLPQTNGKKDMIAIANTGSNQILAYNISENTVSVLAGDGSNGMVDGRYPNNSLSQTADLKHYDGKLYFIDSGSASLRVFSNGEITTLIGKGVDQFGNSDGEKSQALMRYPLGLEVDDTGVYITDSFNHKIRKYNFATKRLQDFTQQNIDEFRMDKPEGIVSVLDRFYVADSNNNRVLVIYRGTRITAQLFNVMPQLRLMKEGFMEYLPNLERSENLEVKNTDGISLTIDLKSGWKINKLGPSFINLLELVKNDEANLVDHFDWNAIQTKKMVLPKLKEGRTYILQGSIYFCEDRENALCFVKSYEQRLRISDESTLDKITIKLGYK